MDQLGLPIGAAARRVPRQRREGWKDRAHMVLLHLRIAIGGLDTPQRQQRAALDAKVPLDPGKQCRVLPQCFLAGDDAPVRHPAIDVLPNLLAEFRLLLHLLEYGHIGFEMAHDVSPGRIRNALRQRARAKAVTPLLEAWRRRGKSRDGMREQGGGPDARSQQGAAGRSLQGRIRLLHQASLTARRPARQRPSWFGAAGEAGQQKYRKQPHAKKPVGIHFPRMEVK